MNTRDFSRGKGGRCIRLTTLVEPNVKKIRGLNLPGAPSGISACFGRPLPFYNILVHWGTGFANRKGVLVKFVTMSVTRRDSALSYLRVVTESPLWPHFKRNILRNFRHTTFGQLVLFDASWSWVRRQFLAKNGGSKLKCNIWPKKR
jgi:hypothetical protein